MKKIHVIDLFAGPGGLGEGFSAFSTQQDDSTHHPFSIKMSVEKDIDAHQTLQLRAFFRKFREGDVPEAYYEYLKYPKSLPKEELFRLYKNESDQAIEETFTRPIELGTDDDITIIKRLKALKKSHSGPWVVIGGPPCQAYSLVGRSRNSGITDYTAEQDHRHFLYREYLKVLSLIEPEVFVMENVKGILSSSVGSQKIFPQILEDLRYPSKAQNKRSGHRYKIYSLVAEPDDFDRINGPVYKNGSEYVIRTERYGIPQMRHRVILVGIREDIETIPDLLKQRQPVSIDQVIDGMPSLRSGLSKEPDSDVGWERVIETIKSSLLSNLEDIKADDQVLEILNIDNDIRMLNRGGSFVSSRATGFKRRYHSDLRNWISDTRLKGFVNHETRGHMRADLERYLWCSAYAKLHSESRHPSPKSKDFPVFLFPKHKSWSSKKFTDRFRVQAKGRPATTITCHISKDGHYFIHYDPRQCRSLTVREAARIQTFPDNYFFEGPRTQQYVQVGNAVAPYLAIQIASRIYKLISDV